MERLNKEYYLNFHDKINLKYGSVNKNLPQVIYVCGSSWITPKFNGEYYSIINSIFSKFKSQLQ